MTGRPMHWKRESSRIMHQDGTDSFLRCRAYNARGVSPRRSLSGDLTIGETLGLAANLGPQDIEIGPGIGLLRHLLDAQFG